MFASQVLEKFNLRFKDSTQVLDVCFMVMSILSYAMVKRADLMRKIDLVIEQHLDQFMSENIPLLV